MVRRNYEALVSGDGACAGCGEKSHSARRRFRHRSLHAPALSRESRAPPQQSRATRKRRRGEKLLALKAATKPSTTFPQSRRARHHGVRRRRRRRHRQTHRRARPDFRFGNHQRHRRSHAPGRFQSQRTPGGRWPPPNGMSVMFMGASTGCNTVYGSTPPSNPHPYPWMNSLFQDGPTIGWLLSEALVMNHARRSVVPERLATRCSRAR
jgi:pyruvate-ferredoxin/flavodoxin oxidoreductase